MSEEEMPDNLHFRGPGFEFRAVGPYAISAAIVIALLILLLARQFSF
jgi:hypothetical protein